MARNKSVSRYRLLHELVYNNTLVRPGLGVIETSPSKLSQLLGMRPYRIAEAIEWLSDYGYLTDVEWKYGYCRLVLNTAPFHKFMPPADAPINSDGPVGSPSSSALAGGVQNNRPPLNPEGKDTCQKRQQEQTSHSQTDSSEKSKNSTSPLKVSLKLNIPSTTD